MSVELSHTFVKGRHKIKCQQVACDRELNTLASVLKKYWHKCTCISVIVVRFLKTLAVFSWPGQPVFRLDHERHHNYERDKMPVDIG